ncbi:MAG: 7-carboxy-7-deazaguanine synthase QueE [Sphingomonadales bacterium]|nr:7-carboxy-7-deazaguanine synthase QueE [Sphingomonadales bacterium]MBD3773683.1 7-carboxy-7-deazaguanine synthase QueE [Paracoccaceae bacterium]
MSLVLATQAPGEPEIFASLQGEGASAGQPCTFLRLSRCNLACQWCDTAYTWRFEGDNRPHRDGVDFARKDNQLTLAEEEVAQRILAFAPRRLVITGGEPLLQAGALAELAKLLPDHRIEVETNGTVAPPVRFDVYVDQYNVSPKLAHSGNPADLALVPERLHHWAAEPRAFFKFVVAQPGDVDEVLALARTYRMDPARIYLMPEGTDSATLRQREQWLAPLCLAHGLRMSDRLHIHLFGDTRGT